MGHGDYIYVVQEKNTGRVLAVATDLDELSRNMAGEDLLAVTRMFGIRMRDGLWRGQNYEFDTPVPLDLHWVRNRGQELIERDRQNRRDWQG